MTLDTFFEKFELLADAPDAVGRMRELVLYFAFSGKLLPHKESVPRAKLGTLATKIGSGATPSGGRQAYVKSGTPLIRSMNVHFRGFEPAGLVFLNESQAAKLAGATVEDGDVLLNITGASIGRVTTAPTEMAGARVNQHVMIIRPKLELHSRFLAMFLANPTVQTLIDSVQVGATREALTKGMVSNFEIPLPPLAEQKRIVAKVEELMALCDRLEAQQRERATRHAALARASLARFAEAPTPANLNLLFHPSYDIPPAELRKAILTLAVQGKLVAQDPADESAADCMKRLGLTFEPQSEDQTAATEWGVPPTWLRVRFEDMATVSGGVTLGRSLRQGEKVTLPYLRVANVKRGEIDMSVLKHVEILVTELDRYSLRENDLLMTEGGDWNKVGRAAVWKSPIPVCLHQNHVFRARMKSAEFDPAWFERYFNSPVGRAYFESCAKQTTNLASINMRQVRSCPVPFPPPAEQRRIIAKVEQLMALVDRLEARLTASRESAGKLLEAVVGELTAEPLSQS